MKKFLINDAGENIDYYINQADNLYKGIDDIQRNFDVGYLSLQDTIDKFIQHSEKEISEKSIYFTLINYTINAIELAKKDGNKKAVEEIKSAFKKSNFGKAVNKYLSNAKNDLKIYSKAEKEYKNSEQQFKEAIK